MINNKIKKFLFITTSVCSSSIAVNANAQGESNPGSEDDSRLEEVLVTVERRGQTIEDVEASVDITSQEDIDALGLVNFTDLTQVTPGLNASNTGGFVDIFIRGLGNSEFSDRLDPAVATLIDGVVIPRTYALNAAFFDLERIEVLLGPQGTVRGRNALGGTLNLISRKPTFDEVEGYVEATLGNYNRREFRGAINLPVSDTLATRVAIYQADRDPFIENVGANATSSPGVADQGNFGGRITVLYEPTDRASIHFLADAALEDSIGSHGVSFDDANANGLAFDDFDGGDLDPRKVYISNMPLERDVDHYGFQLDAKYAFDNFTLNYIGAWREAELFTQSPNLGSGLGAGPEAYVPNTPTSVTSDNFSRLIFSASSESNQHELRIVSPDDWVNLSFATGLYYLGEVQSFLPLITFDGGAGGGFVYPSINETKGEVYSAYFDATYSLTDRLRITAGLRYTDEERERNGFTLSGFFNNPTGADIRIGTEGIRGRGIEGFNSLDANGDGQIDEADGLILTNAAIAQFGARDTVAELLANGTITAQNPGVVGSSTGPQTPKVGDSYTDWRLRIGYDLTGDSLLYASYSTATKAPGLNDQFNLSGDSLPTETFSPTVDIEQLKAFEVGSKNRFDWAGYPVSFNAAVFYYDYSGQALVGPAPEGAGAGISVIQNAGDGSNLGTQLDLDVQLPKNFGVAAGIVYQDATYDEGSVVLDDRAGRGALVDLVGNRFVRTPELELNFRLNHEFDAFAGVINWGIQAKWTGEYYLSAFNGERGKDSSRVVLTLDDEGGIESLGDESVALVDLQESFLNVNLMAGYSPDDAGWRVEAFVNNATDVVAAQGRRQLLGTAYDFNAPRTYGLRLRANF